jgi:hypothetical protein
MNVIKTVAISSAACSHSSGEFVCLLDNTISNPKAVRIIDASVTFAAAYAGVVLICSDNLLGQIGDVIRKGSSPQDNYRTNIISTIRTADSTTVGVDKGAESYWSLLASGLAISELEIHFFDKSGIKLTSSQITDFFIVFQFAY